jgi:ATP-dependent helicase/nuclease subunit A
LKNLDYIRPYELFNYVLSDLGKRRKFIERMGREVEDVLDEFINMTLDYEQREIPTLQGFVSWFEQNEREIKRDSDDSEINAVRLLTVHHSKGLQAPVVILPCAGLLPNTDKENAFLYDDDVGYYPLGSADYEDSCLKIHAQNVEKAMQEYHRLLYVALTRAEDQLIIGAYGKRNAESWYELCRQTFDKGTEPSKTDIEMISEKYVEKEEKKKSLLAQKSYGYEAWIDNNITGAEDNILKPYNPSKSEEDEKNLPDSASPLTDNQRFYRRGTLIHRLLQFLPQNSGDKEKSIDLFLQKYADDFAAEECAQIKDEVLRLINAPEFADIFGEYSRAEVPVMGAVGNKIISAQIDRLVVLPDKIKIVDFKTNRPPAKDVAHTSPQYINQLAAYAELMRQIYPNKPIETYILWTNETRLMQVA